MAEEGWYTDPYRIHEHRWFSDGTPTDLVRDGGATSKDAPPDTPYAEAPTLVRAADDLRRGDDPGGDVDDVEAVWTYFTRSGSGF
jgi:hypothetical protein